MAQLILEILKLNRLHTRIQKCQTRAARIIMSNGWEKGQVREHRQDILDKLGWQNVQQLVTTSILNLTKSSIDGQSSSGVNNMFKVSHPTNPRHGLASRIKHNGKISATNKFLK